METTVYKIVARRSNGELTSVYACDGHRRTYSTKTVTRPAKGTKLFAFATLEEARDWMGFFEAWESDFYSIYLAKATRVREMKILSYQILDHQQLLNWFKTKAYKPVVGATCVGCGSIRLIRKVKKK